MSFLPALKKEVQGFPPAYFTLVMSVGITSIGAHLLKYHFISDLLFWSNNIAYGVLMLILLARLLFYTKHFVADLKSFKKGAGFLSLIAGTCILGIQYVQLRQNYTVGSALFWFGIGAWVLLMYTFLGSVTTRSDKPSLEKGISGVWLLMVVSTQTLAILGTLLSKHLSFPQEQVLYLTLCFYTLGLMLYIILITLIFYRLTFFHAGPKEITPPYWINEGAVGITALAGATFMMNISSGEFADIIPVIKWISVLAWATATWWIPVIVLLEVWKYGIKNVSLSYAPTYWALVFCVGGYAVATFQLAKTLGAYYLQSLPEVFFYTALALMGLLFIGMCISLVKSLSSQPKEKTG